jgi:anti-sigma B factor antagonist
VNEIRIVTRRTPLANVVALKGEADLYGAPRIAAALDSAAEGAVAVAVDLSAITFLDSTVVALLLTQLRALEARGMPFTIVCDDAQTLRIFELTGLDRRFVVLPSLTEALRRSVDARVAA